MRFELGQLMMTKGIADLVESNSLFKTQVDNAFLKYIQCDWGKTCDEDKISNDNAINDNERILVAYETCVGTIWMITEWDRSVTTILFPDEY